MTDVETSAAEGLVGRHGELAAVQRFVHALGEGKAASHALLIAGPAGIGKTSLWLSAAAQAEQAGYRVLRARPSETEATFAYAALLDLLRDELGGLLPRLPGQQRTTLQRALGLSEEAAPPAMGDPQLVQAAAATAFLLLASERPLLVAIDDAPWLDQPSAAALQFIARRAGERALGFVLTQRTEEDGPAPLGLDDAFAGRPAERLWLEPLSPGALHRLLGERLEMTLPRPLLIRLHELSGGVPFHALEIARALKGRPLPAAGTTLPIPASLRGLLAARARELPEPARDLLLLVAAAGGLEMHAARSLLGQATADTAAGQGLDEALLALDGSRLRAAHPLVASTVYELANPGQRRTAHERLAGVIVEPEARARHRALASTGPNAEIAEELEEAGRRARERGAPEVAAELLRLAGERTPAGEPESRDRRALALAEALHGAADLQAAQPLLDELIGRLPPGRLLGRARILRSEVCWYTATSVEAVAQLEAGLGEVGGEPDLQAQMHYRLAVFYDYDIARALEHARRAVALLDDRGDPALLASSLMQLFGSEVALGFRPRPELLERALAIEPPDTGEANTIPGIWWLALDRTDEARDRFRAMLERDRRRGDLSSEADLLTKLAETEALADRFADARELADAATAAARQQGYEAADPARRIRALVDAYEGRLAEAREVAGPAAERAAAAGDRIIAVAWLVVLTLAAATERDWQAVVSHVAQSEDHLSAMGAVEPLRLGVKHELPEALVSLSRLDEAAHVLDELEERQARLLRPWLEAAIVRGRAELLAARGDPVAAASLTEVALGARAAAWRRFDRARTLLVRGGVLRRARARREAAAALDQATAIFDEIGAVAWAARARAESERLGRHRPGSKDLTPTEQQVSRLAAEGLTNREVAERLSVSPKTVEAHLARAYAKLGIRSRAELGRLMAER